MYPPKDALLDILFNKTEQQSSILLESKKGSKPPLDTNCVNLLFGNIKFVFLM